MSTTLNIFKLFCLFFRKTCLPTWARIFESKVYVTVQCPSVRLSVPLQRQKSSLTQPDHRQPGCGNMGHKTALSSKCGQCHVYSQWGRLNIDLFKLGPRRRGALSDTAIRPSVRLSVPAMARSCPRL